MYRKIHIHYTYRYWYIQSRKLTGFFSSPKFGTHIHKEAMGQNDEHRVLWWVEVPNLEKMIKSRCFSDSNFDSSIHTHVVMDQHDTTCVTLLFDTYWLCDPKRWIFRNGSDSAPQDEHLWFWLKAKIDGWKTKETLQFSTHIYIYLQCLSKCSHARIKCLMFSPSRCTVEGVP